METISLCMESINSWTSSKGFSYSVSFSLIFPVLLNLLVVIRNFPGLGETPDSSSFTCSRKWFSSRFPCFVQERDAERRRQLRERARQLIAEARSGVKMSEMSLLDTSGAERGKSSRTSPVAGQHASLKSYKCTPVSGTSRKAFVFT